MTTETPPAVLRLSAELGAGTDLYRRALAFNDDDAERKALMAQVWRDTPWMVDAYTGSHDDNRRLDLMQWCREQFGPEAWPIHGRPGQWHSGGATVHGWTWMGFATEEQMRRFVDRWPAPNAELTGARDQGPEAHRPVARPVEFVVRPRWWHTKGTDDAKQQQPA